MRVAFVNRGGERLRTRCEPHELSCRWPRDRDVRAREAPMREYMAEEIAVWALGPVAA